MANYSKLHIRKRITVLFLIVVFLMFGLFSRLVWVQVVTSANFQTKALNQRLRQLKVEPKRGVIYDREGTELAISGTAETVVATPAEIKNPEETARVLAGILTMSEDEVYSRVTANKASVYIHRKVSPEVAAKIRKINLPGVSLATESKRYYPHNELASHIIGFAGIDSQGLLGLEIRLDEYLRGIPGSMAVERDAKNHELPNGVQKFYPAKDGDSVYLTLNQTIQHVAERELEAGLTTMEADGGSVIVMNPETGEVLALANRPTFDPNQFSKYPKEDWKNRAVVEVYEPGSTFKVITTVSGLEEGVVSPNDTFFCKGSIVVAGETLHCWKDGGHGSLTFAEVVQNSCNVGFVQVGQRIGVENMQRYIDAFGFGKKTEVGLPGEEQGIRYRMEDIGPVELATMAFGHSISVTPIQLVTAISAVANDGVLMRPHVVKEIRTPEGELVKEFKPEPVRQVISKETAVLGRELLANVVAEGTGKNAQVEGYEIGGKTGTAEWYGVRAYDTSFIGMVPVDDPKLVILVVLYKVTSEPHFASQTAAPIFQKVAREALITLEIPPKKLPEKKERPWGAPKDLQIPDLRNLPIDEARKELMQMQYVVKVEGDGDMVVDQVPKPGVIMTQQSTIVLFAEDGLTEMPRYYVTVPDLKGMSVGEAARLLAELGLRIKYASKEGTIYKQVPAPHSKIESGSEIKIFVK